MLILMMGLVIVIAVVASYFKGYGDGRQAGEVDTARAALDRFVARGYAPRAWEGTE